MGPVDIDALVRSVLEQSPLRFTATTDRVDATPAFRLRAEAVAMAGWRTLEEMPGGLEIDEYDDRAVHVVGWDGARAAAAGRIVLPPGPLPTEDACGVRVHPEGRVVDVGRMVVAPGDRGPGHGVFGALLASLYLEVRRRGFEVACGMMSPAVRVMCRQLGITLELLGEDRSYWGDLRAPVRFDVRGSASSIRERWA